MPDMMLDTDNPALLSGPLFAGCRVATYADLVTPLILSNYLGRLIVIDRGRGDPHNAATVADIEPTLLTVAEGVAKIKQWVAEHRPFPTAYCDRNDWPAVDAALAGIPHHDWIATLDGTLLPDGRRPAVVQVWGETALGFHADLSIVWDDTWHPIRPAVSWASVAGLEATATTLAHQIQLLR
jgi:hypothetical protein